MISNQSRDITTSEIIKYRSRIYIYIYIYLLFFKIFDNPHITLQS